MDAHVKKLVGVSVISFIVGLLVMTVIWFIVDHSSQPQEIASEDSIPPKEQPPKEQLPKARPSATEPKVDFSYRSQLREIPHTPPPKTGGINAKIIQVGIYSIPENAEAMKVRLLFLNLPVEVRQLKNSGKTQYQVVVGPFKNSAQTSQATAILLREKIEYVY